MTGNQASAIPVPSRILTRAAGVAAVVFVGVILVLTFTPSSMGPVRESAFCILCGDGGLANLLRNIILFMPAGFFLVKAGVGVVTVVVGLSLLTLGIESAQIFIPGRNPLVIDWAMNTLGGILGAALGRALPAALQMPDHRRRLILPFAALVPVLSLMASALLLSVPGAPPDPWVQLNPRAGFTPPHPVPVSSLRVAGERVERGPLAHPVPIDRFLTGHGLMEMEFSGPPSLAPGRSARGHRRALMRVIAAEAGREMIWVGLEGSALVLRMPHRAESLTLARPEVVTLPIATGWGNAGAGPEVDPNDLKQVTVGLDGQGRIEFSAAWETDDGDRFEEQIRARSWGLADGWTLLHGAPGLPEWARGLLGVLFIGGLFAVSAAFGRGWGSVLALVPGAATLAVGHMADPWLAAPLAIHWVGVPVGWALGLCLATIFRAFRTSPIAVEAQRS